MSHFIWVCSFSLMNPVSFEAPLKYNNATYAEKLTKEFLSETQHLALGFCSAQGELSWELHIVPLASFAARGQQDLPRPALGTGH